MKLDYTQIMLGYIRANGKACYIVACAIAWLEDSIKDPVQHNLIKEQFGTRLIEFCKEYEYE